MAEEVIVFIQDGIVEGVFATSADTHVCIVDFDKDSGDRTMRMPSGPPAVNAG